MGHYFPREGTLRLEDTIEHGIHLPLAIDITFKLLFMSTKHILRTNQS